MDKNNIAGMLSHPAAEKIIRLIIVLIAFLIVYYAVRKLLSRVHAQRLTAQAALAIQKILKYVCIAAFVLYVLDLFDIHLTAVLGAAGIAGVAVGFAAQTSFSNIISGFFLLSDKALKIGDYITVDGVSGTVDAIDFLSVKIHTVDNTMVRIPNETIIKSNLCNVSYFPVRRAAITVSVGYDTDLSQALELLLSIAKNTPLVLADPEPIAYIDGMGDSGIDLVLAAWANSADFRSMKSALYIAVQTSFAQAGIEIPFPKQDINFPQQLHIVQDVRDNTTQTRTS